MRPFIIFALIFTLSAQQNAIGEEGQDQAIDSHGSNGCRSSGNQMRMPYRNIFFGGLEPKMTFTIRGFVPRRDSSFAIDFMAGSDVALHINPRLSQGTVVRNSLLNGSWGPEELDLPFNPFEYGKSFELSICCDKHQFTVYANDKYLFAYTHRYIDFHRINKLEIKGDVIISYVHY